MPSTPVQPHQRIHYLDILRGVAITGVLLAYVFWNLGNVPLETYTSFEKGLDAVLEFLVDSKCYTLLANLFAVGFVLHMNKAEDGKKSLHTYWRRLIGLIIIGIVHALVLRNGDILIPYAVLTFLVSFFYNASNRTIITGMVITFLLQITMPDIWKFLKLPFPERPAATNDPYLIDNFHWVKYWYESAIFYWETTLFFLFSGMLLGRIFIEKKKRLTNKQLISIALIGTLAGWLSFWILHSYSTQLASLEDIGNTNIIKSTLYSLLWLIHRVGLAAAYASIIYLLSNSFSLKTFATLGRTSLSNYILQAVIVVPLCMAFNLFDHIRPATASIMTVSIWIAQVLLSTWWLKSHRFGPLEWALRRFTYGKSIKKEKVKKATELVSTQTEVF